MARGRGRQRQQSANNSLGQKDDSRWASAIRIPLSDGLTSSPSNLTDSNLSANFNSAPSAVVTTWVLEVFGFESSPRTLFARIRNKNAEHQDDTQAHIINHRCRWRIEDLVEIVVQELTKQIQARRTASTIELEPQVSIISHQTLLSLGTVWILDPSSADRPQNKPIWKRILRHHATDSNDPAANQFLVDESMTLRIHSRPSRYPMAQKFEKALKSENIGRENTLEGGIVFERTIDSSINNGANIPAFAVLYKPFGLPSHSTVDNAVENLLYLYQRHRELDYASLPQRLDSETSGLILVATHKKFASYFSKLLEQKTNNSNIDRRNEPIQKLYRCLVALPKDSWEDIWKTLDKNYICSNSIVEHYVDTNSKAPKTFIPACEFSLIQKETKTENSGEDGAISKWQLCRLRIRHMRGPIQPKPSSTLPQNAICFELEIELLTGRTHQIRGQLAALGCPIIGDPLYGKGSSPQSWEDRSGTKMALQCCSLSFPMDDSIERKLLIPKSKRKKRFGNDAQSCTDHDETKSEEMNSMPRLEFFLDSAWWRD